MQKRIHRNTRLDQALETIDIPKWFSIASSGARPDWGYVNTLFSKKKNKNFLTKKLCELVLAELYAPLAGERREGIFADAAASLPSTSKLTTWEELPLVCKQAQWLSRAKFNLSCFIQYSRHQISGQVGRKPRAAAVGDDIYITYIHILMSTCRTGIW